MNFIEIEAAILRGGSNTTGLGLLAVAKAINAHTAWEMTDAMNSGTPEKRGEVFLINLNFIEEKPPLK